MPLDVGRGFRAGDRDHSPVMHHTGDAVMDPVPAAIHHGVADAVHAELAVVIAADGENRCNVAEHAHQRAHVRQLGAAIHQVAPQQHHIRIAASRSIQHLPAQRVGTTVPEVNVADVQQSTRVMPRRQPLFADMEGVCESDLQTHLLGHD